MSSATGVAFGSLCRGRRLDLDLTQAVVADALGMSRGHYSEIETGRINVSAAQMDRIAEVLGFRLRLSASLVLVAFAPRARDGVHAWCSAMVARRLQAAGWEVRREVEIREGRLHGWIDIVAFHPVTRTLLLIEVKTSIDDVGRLERQVGWYERAVLHAISAAWAPRHVATWVLALASAEVDEVLAQHRSVFDERLPDRASTMRAVVDGQEPGVRAGIALIDPRSRRRDWLIATRLDGRRTPAPYQDREGAARLLDRRRSRAALTPTPTSAAPIDS